MLLVPNRPYSALKVSADMIIGAYYETFGIRLNITRCSNNYDPFQFSDKLILFMISNCVKERGFLIYCDRM